MADALVHSAEDYNLEEEYGWFLDGIVKYVDDNPDEFLEHYGVKGMHWGQRKSDRPSRTPLTGLGPDSVTAKTKSGETITMTKKPPPAIARAMSRISPNYKKEANNFAALTITDSSGKKVGDAQVTKVNDDEINLIWLGINKSSRGKGYASAAMKTAVEFGKQSGVKKLTLEVPKNSPDARHIYDKLGFKFVKELSTAEDDPAWGGLTQMEYVIDEAKHTADIGASFIAHYGVKGMHWGKVRSRAQIDADSSDVVQVKAAKDKIKTNRTTNVLSNQELQAVVTRMNLEQQYSKLTGPNQAQKQRNDKLKKAGINFVAGAAIARVEAPITALAKAKYGKMGEAAVSAAFSQMKPQNGKKNKNNGNNGNNGNEDG